MKANVKKRLVERDILAQRYVRDGVLNYTQIPGDFTCNDCVKKGNCLTICAKYDIRYNGFGTASSTHCMFDPCIFEKG